MNLKQCKLRLETRERELRGQTDELASSLEEIEYYKSRTEWSLAQIKDLERQIKGLRNLIMQLEGE